MFVQTLIFLSTALLACTAPVEYDGFNQAGLFNTYATKAHLAPHKHDEDYDDHVEYNFNYSVHDEHTGDIKSQEESRNGDVVRGRYELIDPDGYRRVVEYTADDEHGFNAVVHREPADLRLTAHKTDPVSFDQYPLNAAKLHRASHYPGSSQLTYGGLDVK